MEQMLCAAEKLGLLYELKVQKWRKGLPINDLEVAFLKAKIFALERFNEINIFSWLSTEFFFPALVVAFETFSATMLFLFHGVIVIIRFFSKWKIYI